MNVKYSKPIINTDNTIKNLLTFLFEKLQIEFSEYLEKINSTELFNYNERALLGFVINSLIRNDNRYKYIPIQEFSVYNKNNESVGRADLLVCDTNTNNYYLIESKRNMITETFDNKWTDKSTPDYLKKIIGQVQKYYKAEEDFYKKKKTYLIVLVFDYIYPIKDLNQYLKKVNSYQSKLKNYFYTFFYSDKIKDNGLSVYGLVELKNNR